MVRRKSRYLQTGAQMKVIETKYKGIIFRSRTEARWAVFMDEIGVRYDYEPEAYELEKGIVYLPDFWIPSIETYLEIKPDKPNSFEEKKAFLLARKRTKRVIVFVGNPVLPSNDIHSGYMYFPSGSADEYYWWCECPMCGAFGIEWGGSSHKLQCGHSAVGCQNFDSKRLVRAYEIATQRRFWISPGVIE